MRLRPPALYPPSAEPRTSRTAKLGIERPVVLLARLANLIAYGGRRQHQIVHVAVGPSAQCLQGHARAQTVRLDIDGAGVPRAISGPAILGNRWSAGQSIGRFRAAANDLTSVGVRRQSGDGRPNSDVGWRDT